MRSCVALLLALGFSQLADDVHAQPVRKESDAGVRAVAPPLGDFALRAQRLFEAIQRDDPAHAADLFFPRAAFLRVKAIPNPGRYYDRLYARFEQDVHALHKTLAKDARFERFELSKRGGYVNPGEEGNHLPYWAARHCFLHYREGTKAKKLEVRVLITWEERWYLIHLSEFN